VLNGERLATSISPTRPFPRKSVYLPAWVSRAGTAETSYPRALNDLLCDMTDRRLKCPIPLLVVFFDIEGKLAR
jgi:hypothetical protein